MRNIFKPWVFVTTGIVFNIISAVITHYFIEINNQNIHQLENNIGSIDALIDSQWRSKTEIDRKEEFLITLLAQTDTQQSSLNKQIQTLTSRQISNLIKQHNLDIKQPLENNSPDFATIISISQQAKQKIIQGINDSYLERLELDQQRHPLNENNALLSTIAIFLQVSGLILVISKDISP